MRHETEPPRHIVDGVEKYGRSLDLTDRERAVACTIAMSIIGLVEQGAMVAEALGATTDAHKLGNAAIALALKASSDVRDYLESEGK